MGRMVNLRPDWEQVKDGIMLEILRSKFAPGTRCAERLLATGNFQLNLGGRGIELDSYLGELLERVRDELRHAAE